METDPAAQSDRLESAAARKGGGFCILGAFANTVEKLPQIGYTIL